MAIQVSIISSNDGSRPPAWLLERVRVGRANGVSVFLRANAGDIDGLAALTRRLHEAAPDGDRERLQLAVRAELGRQVRDVVAHRVHAHMELLGDRGVREPAREHLEHLVLATREVRVRSTAASPSVIGNR